MEEEYKPTKKEICSEMLSVAKKGLQTAARQTSRFGAGFLFTSTSPYTLATHIRFLDSWLKGGEEEGPRAVTFGAVLGFYVAMAQGITYALVSGKESHPEILLIPAATNVASGAYELGRWMYKDAKKRILERRGSQGLESKVGTANLA